jgi:tetratricopeptide (TPR) repeat protein
MRALLVLLDVALLLGVGLAHAQENSTGELLTLARRGDCTQALEARIDQAATSSPQDTRAHEARAICRASRADFDGAAAALQEIVRLSPARKAQLAPLIKGWQRAAVLVAADRQRQAGSPAAGAARIDRWLATGGARCPSVLHQLALCRMDASEPDKAMVAARAGLAAKCADDAPPPNERAELHVVIGAVLLSKKNLAGAEREIRKALSMADKDSTVAEAAYRVQFAIDDARGPDTSPDPPPRMVVPDVRSYRCRLSCEIGGKKVDVGEMIARGDGHNDASSQATSVMKRKGVCGSASRHATCEQVR